MQLTYTTNAMEDAILAAAVAELNAAELEGGSGPGTWTPQTFVATFGINVFIAGQGLRFQDQLLQEAIAAFPDASPNNQAIVLGKLNLLAYASLTAEALLPIFQSMGMPNFLQLGAEDKAAVFAALGF